MRNVMPGKNRSSGPIFETIHVQASTSFRRASALKSAGHGVSMRTVSALGLNDRTTKAYNDTGVVNAYYSLSVEIILINHKICSYIAVSGKKNYLPRTFNKEDLVPIFLLVFGECGSI